MDTVEMSNAVLASAASVDCKDEGVDLHKVRRALRRRSARVRRLILPSLLRRPTLRLLVTPVDTTDTSLSSTLAGTSLVLLIVSCKDSSCVRPDLQCINSVLAFGRTHIYQQITGTVN